MIARKGLTLLAAMVLGASLVASPALARCPKDCKQDIGSDFRACKVLCRIELTRLEKRTCKRACIEEKKRRKGKCRTAASPTFPNCSPSGAFLDSSLD